MLAQQQDLGRTLPLAAIGDDLVYTCHTYLLDILI